MADQHTYLRTCRNLCFVWGFFSVGGTHGRARGQDQGHDRGQDQDQDHGQDQDQGRRTVPITGEGHAPIPGTYVHVHTYTGSISPSIRR